MDEALRMLHFSAPLWLWGIPAWVLLVAAWRKWRPRRVQGEGVQAFADPHLLPFLLMGKRSDSESSAHGVYAVIAVTGVLLLLALAGPRWDFDEQPVFRKSRAVVALLDLSRSMTATDVKPNRIVRAKQEIRDLLTAAETQGVSVGLVGFAASAHILSPITENVQTIEQFLPALEPDLFTRQGSDPQAGLQQAYEMLTAYAEQSGLEEGHIVLLTDGDMPEAVQPVLRELTGWKEGALPVRLHVLAVGSEAGAPVVDGYGRPMRNDAGMLHMSQLDTRAMQQIASATGGIYREAEYLSRDTDALMQELLRGEQEALTQTAQRIWKERYLWALIPAMLLLLRWVPAPGRRAAMLLAGVIITPQPLSAEEVVPPREEFKAMQSYAEGKYGAAAATFKDPYRQGVAHVKGGDFKAAEEAFAAALERYGDARSAYNLGNSRFYQGNVQGAVEAYKQALQAAPDHVRAKHNLKLAEQLLQSRQQSQQNQQAQQGKQPEGDKQQSGQGEQGQQQSGQQQSESEGGNKQSSSAGDAGPQGDRKDKSEQGENKDQQAEDALDNAQKELEQEGENSAENSENDGQDAPGEQQGEQQTDSPVDANMDRLLDQISGKPTELMRNRLRWEEQKERQEMPAKEMNPW